MMTRLYRWKRLMLTRWLTGCCSAHSVRMLPVAQSQDWQHNIIRVLLSSSGLNRGLTVHCRPARRCLTEVKCECCCFGDAEIA
ncbi:hypothetical protein BX18_18100 [Escherichia coli O111:NM str. 2009C-4006]|nr:hypothetical protein BX02_01730 [Escherichia coli O145:NM str. 08-4270]EZE39093.1 hypothetical protein BX18_18100 [Escherichia coli O111:NM str. 2009C-4006]EZH14174.1 hypothetical protein BX13_16440 [Escherichia coli O26:H11 str. 2009C-3612]